MTGLGGGSEKPRVSDYMTRDVATVVPDATVTEVVGRIVESEDHNGFPVCEGRTVRGFVSARDLLAADGDALIADVMSDDLLVADPEMAITDAARVILRSGIQKLPVVDEDGSLVGIISNADVIRSQIERATPEKVERLRHTLETLHDVEATEERREVRLDSLVPTQPKVYADELEGRRYELERGLAEPLVVLQNGDDDRILLADGHHRVLAARSLDVAAIDAYVIVLPERVDLGLARTARDQDLESIDDIEVVDYARHPLVETTERLQ